MIEFNPVHLAYAVMIMAMVLCFFLGKKSKRDIRGAVDEFALPFVRLSNHISPTPPSRGIQMDSVGGGHVRALSMDQQSGTIRAIMRRANEETAVQLYAQLVEAADKIEALGRGNKTWNTQFVEPINELLEMTHVFLNGCEDPGTIDTREKKQQFDSFLMEQVRHRMTLLKRISGRTADEYRELNGNYLAEMERLERLEMEERRKR